MPDRDCICVGELLQFECTVSGTGTTIWDGTAFTDCTGNRVALRHSQFREGTNNSCNNGDIFGKNIGDGVDNCFTSRLNVTVSDTSLEGQTIQCNRVQSQTTFVIGTYTISLITGTF